MAKQKRDFTLGNPGNQLLVFAFPLIISMVLQNLYNTADVVIVGRFVGESALAAVGTSSTLMRVMLMLVTGATQGMSVIISQFYGANDEESVKKTITTSFFLIIGISLVLSVLGAVYSRQLLEMIKVPADVLEDATAYLRIILAGTLVTALYNMANFVSRSLGDSVTPTIVLVITSILNVGFNLMFVLIFNLGVVGVAYGTVLATAISAVVCWVIVWHKMPIVRPDSGTIKADPEIVKMVTKIGIPSALQSSTVSIGALLVQSFVNVFGSTVMAAYGAATKIEALVSYPPGGITQAMQVFTGQNVGAGKFERVKQGFKSGLKIIAIYSVISASIMVFGGRTLMSIFSKEAGEMLSIGHIYLAISGVGVFFCGLLFMARSTLIGAGDAAAGVYISSVELVVRIVGAYILSKHTSLGYVGVFLATPIAWIVAGLYGYYRYKKGQWQEKRLVEDVVTA